MKILVIDDKKDWWTAALDAMMQERGIGVAHLSPTLLSAITALKTGMLIDRVAADLVVASNMSHAAAAVSGCSIASRHAKPVVIVQPSTKAPHGIPSSIAREVVAWIFPTERCRAAYGEGLKDACCIAPPISHLSFPAPDAATEDTLLWAGPIDGNSQRLRQVIKIVDSDESRLRILVYGTGKAQEVMPAVRDGRAMTHPSRLQWLDPAMPIEEAAAKAGAIVQAGTDPTGLELALVENGRTLLVPSDDGFTTPLPYPTTSERADALASLLKSLC